MKSLSRNVALTMFLAFAIGLIWGCAEKPITFAGPGVQIWKLNAVYDDGSSFKDQTLVLKPSETEKDVFHVTATIDTETEGDKGQFQLAMEWKPLFQAAIMALRVKYGLPESCLPHSIPIHLTMMLSLLRLTSLASSRINIVFQEGERIAGWSFLKGISKGRAEGIRYQRTSF